MDVLIALLPLTPFFNWPVFVILLDKLLKNESAPEHKKGLALMTFMALSSAILSTVYSFLVLAEAFSIQVSRDLGVLSLVMPVYLFTIISAVFLYLTVRRKW